jgi:hypothetical protein
MHDREFGGDKPQAELAPALDPSVNLVGRVAAYGGF